MNLKRTITPLALVLTMAVGATPALAQSGNRDGQRRSQARAARPNGGGDRTQSRAAQAPDNRDRGSRAGEAGGRFAVPRAAPGVDDSRRAEIQRNDRGAGNRGYDVGRQDSRVNDSRRAEIQRNDRGAGNLGYDVGRQDSRVNDSRRVEIQRNDRGAGNRGYDVGRQDSRVNDSRRGEVQRNGRVSGNRGYAVGRQDSRVYDSRRYDDRRYDSRRYDDRRYDSRRYDDRRYDSRRYDGRVYSNRGYGSGYYGRPYAIRPGARFGLGISIFAGNPFAFSFRYGRTPSYAYRYPIRTGIAYGGMSFLVDPDDTEVIIDGVFVGIAREFGGQPVPVAVGYHRIELYAQGCEPVAFDVNVMPGQVIPYRGSLMPVSGY